MVNFNTRPPPRSYQVPSRPEPSEIPGPPVQQPVPPRPPEQKKSNSGDIIVGLMIAIPLMLFVTAVVLVVGLLALGNTVESEFTPIENPESASPAPPVLQDSPEVSNVVEPTIQPFEEPTADNTFSARSGDFSVDVSRSWREPIHIDFDGTDSYTFVIPELSTTEFTTTVRFWAVEDQVSTLEQIANAQASESGLDLQDFDVIGRFGSGTLNEVVLANGFDEDSVGSYMIVYKTRTGYAAGLLTTTGELLPEAVDEQRSFLNTLRYHG